MNTIIYLDKLSSILYHRSVNCFRFIEQVQRGSVLFFFSGLEDQYMKAVDWQNSIIHELDLTSTELSESTLSDMLTRMNGFTFLGLGYCEFFTDKVTTSTQLCLKY